jgi:CHAT domain-containing protein
LSQEAFDHRQIGAFLQLCADEQLLNSRYLSFAALSNQLYLALFKPLHLSTSRVIICSDNFLLPFEALCTDTAGRRFLLQHYIFSYVYSARYLLKKPIERATIGNFIGFAPVSFESYLGLPDLKQSANCLQATANNYSNTRVFEHAGASKENFLGQISGYSIVSIFSHASADTGDREPLLFLQDSVIRLSELQLLPEPATSLVVLSACQTNVGKIANGEGIYSLSRGFAAAGIPAVVSTMWQADEFAVYAISRKFHQYLAAGVRKDLALQKAKLDFIGSGSLEKSNPYFWANMVLVGNAEPIHLSPAHTLWWKILIGSFILFSLLIIIAWRRRSEWR